jgi:hypothetical protein
MFTATLEEPSLLYWTTVRRTCMAAVRRSHLLFPLPKLPPSLPHLLLSMRLNLMT